MYKFKNRYYDFGVFEEHELEEPGYDYQGISYARPFLAEYPEYDGYYDDPGELLDLPTYLGVVPTKAIKSPMRTPESDAEAVKWFRRNSKETWMRIREWEPEVVVLCYKENIRDGQDFYERRYPLAIMYLSRNGKRHLVKTDIFEEV